MTELEQIAESVAKALGMRGTGSFDGMEIFLPQIMEENRTIFLFTDGSNLFDPYWRCRCMDWLLEHRIGIELVWIGSQFGHSAMGPEQGEIEIKCPAAEFPARAIHELMTKKG